MGDYPRVEIKINPHVTWGQVELYRCQHGELPPQTVEECKELDYAEALRNVAKTFRHAARLGDPSRYPDPHNVMTMLEACAARFDELERERLAGREEKKE